MTSLCSSFDLQKKLVMTSVHFDLVSMSRTTGTTCSTHFAYITADGCNPSAASSRESDAASRDEAVTSTNRAPTSIAEDRHTPLNASISRATADRSRPLAKGVTLQSGMESTTRWPGSFANESAVASTTWNAGRN